MERRRTDFNREDLSTPRYSMNKQSIAKVEKLIKKGVRIPNPGSVDIGDEVDVERISGDGVAIYSGCKIYGKSTLILQGARLGYEGPATLEDCLVGPSVSLKGGFFSFDATWNIFNRRCTNQVYSQIDYYSV